MAFTFATWNVEKLRGDAARLKRAGDFIKGAHPGGKPIDIFGILEVAHVDVSQMIQTEFPDYDFHLTDGPQVQEILVGVLRGVFDQKAFVQKREFKAGNEFLRPGALLSVRQDAAWTHLLYMHTDSGVDADAFGNRFNMFNNIRKMKEALDGKDPSGAARLIVMGDLNTMGLQYPKATKANIRIKAAEEILELPTFAGLRVATKSHDRTWKGSAGESDLDHILVTPPVTLAPLGKAGAEIRDVCVRGWVELTDKAAVKAFLKDMSDHCLLLGETA